MPPGSSIPRDEPAIKGRPLFPGGSAPNHASDRVMQELGFGHEREVAFAGLPHRFLHRTADEWKRRPRPGS